MQKVFDAYAGYKTKLEVTGYHNSMRPVWAMDEALAFIMKQISPENNPTEKVSKRKKKRGRSGSLLRKHNIEEVLNKKFCNKR